MAHLAAQGAVVRPHPLQAQGEPARGVVHARDQGGRGWLVVSVPVHSCASKMKTARRGRPDRWSNRSERGRVAAADPTTNAPTLLRGVCRRGGGESVLHLTRWVVTVTVLLMRIGIVRVPPPGRGTRTRRVTVRLVRRVVIASPSSGPAGSAPIQQRSWTPCWCVRRAAPLMLPFQRERRSSCYVPWPLLRSAWTRSRNAPL